MIIRQIRPTAPLTAPRIDENYPNDKIYACDAKRAVSGQYGSDGAIIIGVVLCIGLWRRGK